MTAPRPPTPICLVLLAFLAGCGGGSTSAPAPTGGFADHTLLLGTPGVAHGTDPHHALTTCAECHGASLEGEGAAPACASCHDEMTASGGAALWDVQGCDGCHGMAGEGAFANDVRCLPATAIAATLRDEALEHFGGQWPDLDDREVAALVAFLGSSDCPTGRRAPPSHDVPMGTAGILHHPGFASPIGTCTACHGPQLEGYRGIPSCASCHGGSGTPTTGCSGCHASAQDNGDGIPAGGRRAAMGEFALTSHHLHGAEVDDADCSVCHDMSAHRQGKVRLLNVDAPTDASKVVVLEGDPAASDTEAAKLTAFCLACHDSDGAGGAAPFTNGAMPSVVDKTAWDASTHATEALSCFGSGATAGCHSSGHGAANPKLLRGAYLLVEKKSYTSSDYQACWDCHSASAVVSGTNAFATLHKKHVQDKGYACINCHDPHNPHDTGEQGLISFDHALDTGFDISLLAGSSKSDAFWVNTTTMRGYCAIKCHGETHDPESYSYAGGGN